MCLAKALRHLGRSRSHPELVRKIVEVLAHDIERPLRFRSRLWNIGRNPGGGPPAPAIEAATELVDVPAKRPAYERANALKAAIAAD